MELIVHGHIDGVNINELILQRVTRSTDQNITAALTFNDDFVIYGEYMKAFPLIKHWDIVNRYSENLNSSVLRVGRGGRK